MNKLTSIAAVGLTFLMLTACTKSDPPVIEIGDIEDYNAFIASKDVIEDLEPFKAEPLKITATGKVRAEPDVAVIAAQISGTDKNESLAFNIMSEKVNKVQNALSNHEVETGFISVNSERKSDQDCILHNQAAYSRRSNIRSDFYFNRRLDRSGDTETKRRTLKPRLNKKVCHAQAIKVSTTMIIRIQPADAAGEALRALADAGAENSRLYGYDFSEYDTHYQEAAEKAVEFARKKAESHARLTNTVLGEIEKFTVSAPERTGRFGPQPLVVRSAKRYRGQSCLLYTSDAADE